MLCASCAKDDNQKIKFGWAKEGTRLVYDYYTATDTIPNYRELYISDRFMESAPGNQDSYELLFHLISREFKVKRGGLYGVECSECRGFGLLGCPNKFDFLFAPNAATLNQELPVYGCGEKIDGINKVVEVDRRVEVPWGTFNTYVILQYNGDRSYWNAAEGLIMYETTDHRGNHVGTLKLSRIFP
jgi:hypothetical protein